MIDFEKKFNSFEAPGAFNLFDPSHPIEFYIGLDDKGRKSLIVRSKEKPENRWDKGNTAHSQHWHPRHRNKGKPRKAFP